MDAGADQVDVAIVGAGMTGATLALALAQGGIRTAVVDAQPLATTTPQTFDGRASAIAFTNLRQWGALGVAQVLEPLAQRIERIVAADGAGPGASARRRLPSMLSFDAEGLADGGPEDEPLGWMVENRHIRAALNTALVQSGIEVFAPAELEALQTRAGRAEITLKDSRRLAGTVVVGADGRGSPVRRAAGIGVSGWDYPQSGVVATVALDVPHDGVAYQVFLPGGPLAVLPLTDDRASLVWTEQTARAEALTQASPEAFEALLARRIGDRFGRPRLAGPRFAYPLRLQVADSVAAPRTALIGDAAHIVHPIAGQGLNTGLKDAAALAEVLVDAHRRGEDLGSTIVLDRYARWRRFDSATLTLATDLFARLFSGDAPLVGAARRAGLALVNRAPAAKRLFAREAGGGLGDLPRLLRGDTL